MSSSRGVQTGGSATLARRSCRRVLVVDDSAFMRRLIADIVSSSGEFDVVGTARDGCDALRQVALLDPDLITLDVDMPGMGGLDALDAIMRDTPRPVVMLSAGGSDGGVDATLRALEHGAVDFVRKPSGAISLDLDVVRDQLLDALRAAAAAAVSAVAAAAAPHRPERLSHGVRAADVAPIEHGRVSVTLLDEPAESSTTHRVSHPLGHGRSGIGEKRPPQVVVVIAASTGGPAALTEMLPSLPSWPDVAVLIVQHMPAGFTASFARRLDLRAKLRVREAVDGELLCAGRAYVAPAGSHLRVRGFPETARLVLDEAAPLWGVRPAADHLFSSVADCFGSATIGVVMTGMGRDGAEGLRALRAAGGVGLVQESTSCVVPGMPDAARRHAGVDATAPLGQLAGLIATYVPTRRGRATGISGTHANE